MEKCINCEEETSVYFTCDKSEGGTEGMDEIWCEVCFENTACGQGVHGEGCATKVFES